MLYIYTIKFCNQNVHMITNWKFFINNIKNLFIMKNFVVRLIM